MIDILLDFSFLRANILKMGIKHRAKRPNRGQTAKNDVLHGTIGRFALIFVERNAK